MIIRLLTSRNQINQNIMKTKTTSVRTANSSVLIFLTSLYLTYIMVNHFVYDKPYPHAFFGVICVFIAAYSSLKRKQYKKK